MRTTATPGFRRKRPASFWPALNRLAIVLIACGLVLLGVFVFHPEILRLREMRANVEKLEQNEERTRIEHLRLLRQRELLKSDPEYLENIARDKLDLMKPGETIIRLDSRHHPAQVSPAPLPSPAATP